MEHLVALWSLLAGNLKARYHKIIMSNHSFLPVAVPVLIDRDYSFKDCIGDSCFITPDLA